VLWIIHRHDRGRAALSRLVGDVADRTVVGAPTDELFASAAEPQAVVLGLEGDFEIELEFVHRLSRRLVGCRWILLARPSELAEVRRLFDTLPAEVMAYPPDPRELGRRIRSSLGERVSDPLSRRRGRDVLAARFAHWFADLELPELIRALDPQLAHVPVLVLGEPGTGRGLIARYIHEFAGARARRGAGSLIHAPCAANDRAGDLLARVRDAVESAGGDGEVTWTLWLEDADRLRPEVQRQIRGWIEFGLPAGPVPIPTLRWITTASDESDGAAPAALDAALARALSGITIRIPPLRERLEAIGPFVADTALRWSQSHRQRARRFGDDALRALREYPWPGNLAELESVVERSLAGNPADPLHAEHLLFEAGMSWREQRPAPAAERAGAAKAPARAERPEAAQAAAAPRRRESDEAPTVRRLVGAVSHEMRNPLTTIRTFTELLPQHFDDEEFRSRFTELVGSDVRRMERVLDRLQELAGSEGGERKQIDVAGLIEELLDERRDAIRSRNLLVLRELDRAAPFVLGDPASLHRVLGGLLDRALAIVPERGDVYVASRHHPAGASGRPSVRVLLRFDTPRRDRAPTVEGTTEAEASIEFIVAEAVVRAQGGRFTLDSTESHETVVVIDLPAPAAS